MPRQRRDSSNSINKPGNVAAQKENEKCPKNKLKDMLICNFNDTEFKIAVLKKLSEMQENTNRQFNELRNQINEHNEYSAKETEILKEKPKRNSGDGEFIKRSRMN